MRYQELFSVRRHPLGRSTIRGGGMFYGGTWRCLVCAETGRSNERPSGPEFAAVLRQHAQANHPGYRKAHVVQELYRNPRHAVPTYGAFSDWYGRSLQLDLLHGPIYVASRLSDLPDPQLLAPAEQSSEPDEWLEGWRPQPMADAAGHVWGTGGCTYCGLDIRFRNATVAGAEVTCDGGAA